MTNDRPALGGPVDLQTTVEHEIRIAEQARPLRDALRQTEQYTDLRGHRHALAAMSAAEALLVLALLERHAETVYRGELGQQLLRPAEQTGRKRDAAIDTDRRVASTSPTQWLRQMPRYRALTERASQ